MAGGPLTKGFRSTMEDRGDISAAVKALNNPAIRDATALWLATMPEQREKLREQFYELIARRRAQLALEAAATRDGERGDHVSVEKPVDSASTPRAQIPSGGPVSQMPQDSWRMSSSTGAELLTSRAARPNARASRPATSAARTTTTRASPSAHSNRVWKCSHGSCEGGDSAASRPVENRARSQGGEHP
ncbi:hypothetical protein JCM10450v2_006084 [Rhodotorula kratochvilovae]